MSLLPSRNTKPGGGKRAPYSLPLFNPWPCDPLLGVYSYTSGVTLCRCEDLWGKQWTVLDTQIAALPKHGDYCCYWSRSSGARGFQAARHGGLAELHTNPASGLA